MNENAENGTEIQTQGDAPNLPAPTPESKDRPKGLMFWILAVLAVVLLPGVLGMAHRVSVLTRQLNAATMNEQKAAHEREYQRERATELDRERADLAAQKTKARTQIDLLQRQSILQKRDTQTARERAAKQAKAFERVIDALGGRRKLELSKSKEGISDIDLATILQATGRGVDAAREVKVLRVEVKTMEEQLAKIKDDLDIRNEEVAQQLVKIESLKRLNEGQKIKVMKLENRISVVCGRSMTAGTASAAPAYRPPAVRTIGHHDRVPESGFKSAYSSPLSTFSADVDTASYAMVRQQLTAGYGVDPDSVRIEEMINYFDYAYPQPRGDHPVAVHVETATCPWDKNHRLVRIGVAGREVKNKKRPTSNLVFLIDVSGSMSDANKLPYVKLALTRLIDGLGKKDRIAIVVYAGAAGLVLPPTPGDQKQTIKAALAKLSAGGSTAGGAGIQLAYDIATRNRVKGGVNRVILCTDGDFNVGVTSRGGLERLIESKRKTGVYLSILGFGMGNYRDGSMEALSNKGNGNYAYIDSPREAEKVLVREINGTLVTIAKDVKIQVNFNKHKVFAYRLVGYENRRLSNEDFNDDKKDAGDIGAGHTVTMLYEVVPIGIDDIRVVEADADRYSVDPSDSWVPSNETLTVKLRYKLPNGKESKSLEVPLVDKGGTLAGASDDFRFAASVAGFGMLLRESKYKGSTTFDDVLLLAAASKGKDKHGYRGEFLKLITAAKKQAKTGGQAGK